MRITLLMALFFAASMQVAKAAPEQLPNIVLIMADDMGYGDLGCYNPNSKIRSPNIDRLARQGLRFTDAHAPAALCVPTRYGLLTGRYPFRMQKKPGSLIPANCVTIGSLLQQRGYKTACIGKWHLGFDGEKSIDYDQPLRGGPVDRGFDYYFGIPASLDIPPYYYIENDRCLAAPTEEIAENHSEGVTPIQGAFWRAGKIAPGFKHAEVLPKITRAAQRWLTARHTATPDQPLFLYFALAAPHTPWLPTANFHGQSRAGDYGDFVQQVDDAVGQVVDTLDRLGIGQNTLVLFTSDNGPVWYAADVARYGHRSAHRYRGMKGDAWEGGHRMPFIARWPGKTQAGSTNDQTICHTDMLATFAAIVGQELGEADGADSFNIMPILTGDTSDASIREATIHQSARGLLCIRQGPWKLIPALGSGGFTKPNKVLPTPGGPTGQLYHLADDPSESDNLFLQHPEIVEQLTALRSTYEQQGTSRSVRHATP